MTLGVHPANDRWSMVQKSRTAFWVNSVECRGYLYRPAAGNGPLPCIVMAHGFGGTQEGSLAKTAEDFAGAGFAALTFDYRNFGESDGEPRQVISIRAQQEDWQAAIAHARSLPDTDRRIALWGSSLSGAHVIEVAAGDPSITAVMAQVPFNGFPRKVEGRTMADSLKILTAALKDRWAGWRGQPPHYIPAVGKEGELAVMASREADEIVRSMDNRTWRNEIAPRVLLDMAWYRPSRAAPRLSMPLLVCLAEDDKHTPAALGRRIADRAPRGEVRQYPCSHFDFYKEEIRKRVVHDQIGFLHTHLAASSTN
ncbi:alpha/beta hydrolase [Phyllobacterium phragmitis]